MSFSLRPATMKDADLLLGWKNDFEVRKWSIVSLSKIKREDHLKWLKKNLDKISIIEEYGYPCGDIRVDDGEVAIKLEENFRGRGLGSKALKCVLLGRNKLMAKIVDGNVSSMRLFLKNGFEVVDHKDDYYILSYERK